MTLPVYRHPDLAGVRAGRDLVVDGDEAHHAVVVRRTRAGERVVLADGAGTSALCTVTAAAKGRLEVRVEECAADPEPLPRVSVVQAVPKGERGELAVSVLTEVGVARVVPWAAERCVATWKGERAAKGRAKWEATARESAKQARRTWFPDVAALASTDDVVALVGETDLALVLHEAEGGVAIDALDLSDVRDVLVVVGPEGGLSDAELDRLTAAGARTVRLGAEVLRTSTAGVAAVAALLSRTPRWGA
ncbi:16S rRNA (uracil(1498)-N(3))-methyltransferase [Nocardioides massiliensis]|uniref:Ribosomal RNA small subunit methyltransferase E n=1 Tax=Nocardioides massiliensis TaxID=1325935 RepID=A0ABT9NQG0_9ACTN|nr:16S rRNA (uracil(1498)-N(3))-methyltransferase [Nocardioides massiliensis]MDP9822419.1 16S rRNA (uracil1498-N3)-methyltransferase [Nocardioides massiliensis]